MFGCYRGDPDVFGEETVRCAVGSGEQYRRAVYGHGANGSIEHSGGDSKRKWSWKDLPAGSPQLSAPPRRGHTEIHHVPWVRGFLAVAATASRVFRRNARESRAKRRKESCWKKTTCFQRRDVHWGRKISVVAHDRLYCWKRIWNYQWWRWGGGGRRSFQWWGRGRGRRCGWHNVTALPHG